MTKNSKQTDKPLLARAVKTMKPGDRDKIVIGENSGLQVTCGSTGVKPSIYRYRSPETGNLTQVRIGRYATVSLAAACVELARMKELSGAVSVFELNPRERKLYCKSRKNKKSRQLLLLHLLSGIWLSCI